ncbi:hypothetical protein TNCV_3551101 [Trichonephila clavipes]|nr:hypothetical protein TNCV_3551101 [Trichonephila clavipes]
MEKLGFANGSEDNVDFLLTEDVINLVETNLTTNKAAQPFFSDRNPGVEWIRGTATAGSDVVQSERPIFDDFFQHLWPYIGNNTANVVFQMVKRLWLIRIDQ